MEATFNSKTRSIRKVSIRKGGMMLREEEIELVRKAKEGTYKVIRGKRLQERRLSGCNPYPRMPTTSGIPCPSQPI